MPEEFEQVKSEFILLATQYGLKVVSGILILIIGWIVANWTARKFRHALDRSQRLDPTMTPLLAKLVRFAVLGLTVVIVLTQFGVETTSLIALVGTAGLAIGLALQGTLSNVASGLMLLVLRPIEVGEKVEVAGVFATVTEIGLMLTILNTPDNIFVAVPNSEIWGKPVRNFDRNPTRRIDMVFGISYGDDMSKAIEVIRGVFEAEPRVLKEPAPVIAVGELADSSVNIFARPWVKSGEFVAVRLALTQSVKERFDAEGISIPFPQRDVHLFQESAA